MWEKGGSGNKNAASSQEEKIAIHEQVPPPKGDEWALEVAEAVKVLCPRSATGVRQGLIKSLTFGRNVLTPCTRVW